MAPDDEFCHSLAVSNEQIRSLKFPRYDKLSVVTCDVGVSSVLFVGDSELFHRKNSVFFSARSS
jgi:hypothetical protein